MDKQRGGSFTVSGWLAILLLAICALEAVSIRHLLAHRQMVIQMSGLPALKISPPADDDDEYVTHAFPENREVCSGFDTICWIRI